MSASCKRIPVDEIPRVRRIVAIGDIHGDWAALKSSLVAAGLTNKSNQWTGGDTHVVQVGDIVDRKSRNPGDKRDEMSEQKILTHLINLKRKAIKKGGNVHLLLGNHEMMNVEGDMRYVSKRGHRDFGGKRRERFRPGGDVSKLMACNMNTVLKIGSWIFSHAGVREHITSKYTIKEINKYVREYLLGNTDNYPEDIDDIFWHREYSQEKCDEINRAAENWNAKNIVVGHTVMDSITSICKKALWWIDTGMSKAFGEGCHIELLEIIDDSKVNIIKGKRPCKSK